MNRRDRRLMALLAAAWPDATFELDGRAERAVVKITWPDERWLLVGSRSLNEVWEIQRGFRSWTFHEYDRQPWTTADVAAWIDRVNAARAASGGDAAEAAR